MTKQNTKTNDTAGKFSFASLDSSPTYSDYLNCLYQSSTPNWMDENKRESKTAKSNASSRKTYSSGTSSSSAYSNNDNTSDDYSSDDYNSNDYSSTSYHSSYDNDSYDHDDFDIDDYDSCDSYDRDDFETSCEYEDAVMASGGNPYDSFDDVAGRITGYAASFDDSDDSYDSDDY